MPAIPSKPQTEGSLTFDPKQFFDAWDKEEIRPPQNNDFFPFMIHAFGLRSSDSYTYRATAEVTLAQVQKYIEYGGVGRLHEWYLDDEGKQVGQTQPSIVSISYINRFILRNQRLQKRTS